MVLAIPSMAFGQPDTLWTRVIHQGSRNLKVIRTLDRGFAVGTGGVVNAERGIDFYLGKTDSLGIT